MIAEVIMLISLTFFLRVLPKFINNKINGDTWYHFAMAESIRNNNLSIIEFVSLIREDGPSILLIIITLLFFFVCVYNLVLKYKRDFEG